MATDNRDREFPIQSRHLTSIPWAMIAPHELQALRNHGQSLARLAERGGLGADEALRILDDRPWSGVLWVLPEQREAYNRWDREKAAELTERVRTWREEQNR